MQIRAHCRFVWIWWLVHFLPATGSIVFADGQSTPWLIGRRVDGVLVDKKQSRPVKIVRLSDKSLVYRDPAKKGTKNVRVDISEKTFDEIRVDDKVWKLVKKNGDVVYHGPVIPAKVPPKLTIVREEKWTDEQLVRLVAMCYWSRYVDIVREFKTNGESAKTQWWLDDLKAKQGLLKNLRHREAYDLARELESVASEITGLTELRKRLNANIGREIEKIREQEKKAEEIRRAGEGLVLDAVLRMFQTGLGFATYDDREDVGTAGRFLNDLASECITDGLFGLVKDGIELSWLGAFHSMSSRISDEDLREAIRDSAQKMDQAIEQFRYRRAQYLQTHLAFDELDAREKVRTQTLEEGGGTPLEQLDKKYAERVDRIERMLQRNCPLPRIERLSAGQYYRPTAERLRELANQVAIDSRLWPRLPAFDRDVSDSLFCAAVLKLQAALIEEDVNCWRDCYSEDAEYAIALLNAALTVCADDRLGSRQHLLAVSHFLAGNFSEAERHCISLERDKRHDPDFLFLYGRLKCASGQMAEGIDDLERAIANGFLAIEIARNAMEFKPVKDNLKRKREHLTTLDVTMERAGNAGFGFSLANQFLIVNRSPFALTNVKVDFVFDKWEFPAIRKRKTEDKIELRFPRLEPNQSIVMTIDSNQLSMLVPRSESYGDLRIRTDLQGTKAFAITEESLKPTK